MLGARSIHYVLIAATLAAISLAGPGALALDFSRAEPDEHLSGGATTYTKTINRNAFSHAANNLSFEDELNFKVGNGVFRKIWVSAPASTKSSDGLGPIFNAKSCQRCHLKDGRGHPPSGNWPDDTAVSMFLRLSIPPQSDADRARLAAREINVVAEPTYGTQLQDFAIQGHKAEGRMHIDYADFDVDLAGGEKATLRRPSYRVDAPGYGPLHPQVQLSPRVAPQMIGLGLLEIIAADDILANADEQDANNDGISGKPNWSRDSGTDELQLGRFGWKAGMPTMDKQNQSAFAGDIGLSTPLSPYPAGDCTRAQALCQNAPHGAKISEGELEVNQELTDLVLFYTRHLAVPARRDVDDANVLAGKKLFHEARCAACHVPSFTTQVRADLPALSGQKIWPYTDLLLHDMGEGLADNRPEGDASGREWRTPPLWGIGLTKVVSGHEQLLHDGRARGLLEAVLWHGGEAQASRDAVVAMSPQDRKHLIQFLESL
ncbi:MAG: di-heme oxidoredictase family protein [Pseudomonadota bacterium]